MYKNNEKILIENEENAKRLNDIFNDIRRIRNGEGQAYSQNTTNVVNTSNISSKSNYKDKSNFEEENYFYKAEVKLKKKLKKFIVMDLIVMVTISFSVFANYIFAFTSDNYENEDVQALAAVEFEANSSAIDLENVLLDNVSILKTKKLIEEARDIEFETVYVDDENLPLNEEVIVQSGKLGSKNITVIQTYENSDLVQEDLVDEVVTAEPVQNIIRKGKSEFLKNNNIHLGDTIYVTDDVYLRKVAVDNSEAIASIPNSLEVVLKEMSGDWCKVNYKGSEGYVLKSKLTSATATPTIIEANRIQKIKLAVSEDMALNKSSGLTLEDFKRILSNNPRDKYGIFESAAEDFYKADRNYNVNGVLLASIGIHESAWGTSKIARDKRNLFGYGAYDDSPYESAFMFDTYYDGIEILAKSLTKNYLNPEGTVLKNGETATGIYYNGNTVDAINVRYASDPEWHSKVFKYMSQLYDSL